MRDSDAAEQMALVLSGHGMQRMSARVLSALLFADTETITAGEIAERLGSSPGSVSTALKMLQDVGLAEAVPAPGSRRTHFRLPDDGWARLMSRQNSVVTGMLDAAERSMETVSAESPVGQRLATMHDFYTYVMREFPALIDRWHAQRQS
jgi:DNA-binding transcriptional regulator GbsR (MarR family)